MGEGHERKEDEERGMGKGSERKRRKKRRGNLKRKLRKKLKIMTRGKRRDNRLIIRRKGQSYNQEGLQRTGNANREGKQFSEEGKKKLCNRSNIHMRKERTQRKKK